MVKMEWAGVETDVDCSEAELAEMLAEAKDDRIFVGVWLGAVGQIGHGSAMMIAREYCDELMGEE